MIDYRIHGLADQCLRREAEQGYSGIMVECRIITIFDADHKDYIALLPLDKNGNDNESGEVYLYRYFEDEEGLPRIENIESDDEYEAAADRFDELLDDEMFDDI